MRPAPEPEHGPFPSSEWLVRVLGPVFQPAANIALVDRADLLQGGTLGCKPIGNETLGLTVPSQ